MFIIFLFLLSSFFQFINCCGFPGSPSNGFVQLTFGVASYRCAQNYHLLGSPRRFCDIKSRVWYPKLPICAVDIAVSKPLIVFGDLEVDPFSNLTDGVSATQRLKNAQCSNVSQSADITVDLLNNFTINGVGIEFLLDSNGTASEALFDIVVENDKETSSTFCTARQSFDSSDVIICKSALHGRYVKLSITTDDQTAISICRIKVFSELALTHENCGTTSHISVDGRCYESHSPALIQSSQSDKEKCTKNGGTVTVIDYNNQFLIINETLSDNISVSNCLTLEANSSIAPGCNSTDFRNICSYPIRYCGRPAIPTNANSVGFNNRTLHNVGEDVIYLCGNETFTISCKPDGFWSTNVSICPFIDRTDAPLSSPVTCRVPEPPISGSVVISTTSDNITIARYQCKDGYKLITETDTRKCLINGTWSDVAPKCQQITCQIPQPLAFGNWSLSRKKIIIGTQAFFRCHFGYILEGPSVLFCNSNGLWNGPWPRCKIHEVKECIKLKADNAEIVYLDKRTKVGQRAFIRCNSGYRLSPSVLAPIVKCLAGGKWNATLLCLPTPIKIIPDRKPQLDDNEYNDIADQQGTHWVLVAAIIAVVILCLISLACAVALLTARRKRNVVSPQTIVPMMLPQVPILLHQNHGTLLRTLPMTKSASSTNMQHSLRLQRSHSHMQLPEVNQNPGPIYEYGNSADIYCTKSSNNWSTRRPKRPAPPPPPRPTLTIRIESPISSKIEPVQYNVYEQPPHHTDDDDSSFHSFDNPAQVEEIIVPIVSCPSRRTETDSEEHDLPEDPPQRPIVPPRASELNFYRVGDNDINCKQSNLNRRWSYSTESDINMPHYYYSSVPEENTDLSIPRASVHVKSNSTDDTTQIATVPDSKNDQQSNSSSSDDQDMQSVVSTRQNIHPDRDIRRLSLPLASINSSSRGAMFHNPSQKKVNRKRRKKRAMTEGVQVEKNILLMDERNWSTMLESNNFELDSSFLEPVKRDTYKPKLFNIAGSHTSNVSPQPSSTNRPKPQARRSSLQTSSPNMNSSLDVNAKTIESSTQATNGATWDAKKFKHRNKKVQFADNVKDSDL